MAYKRSWFIHPNKAHLRKHFRALRHLIPHEKQQAAAKAVAELFTTTEWYLKSKHIACYLAVQNELDCMPIIEAIWQDKKECYLPVLLDQNEMIFVRYRKNDALKLNRYSILEPSDCSHVLPAAELDCVALPLVAFDGKGHRLGVGGGYYDRTFSFVRGVKKPVLIGLSYAAQEADLIPQDEWDLSLDGVVTEEKIFTFSLP